MLTLPPALSMHIGLICLIVAVLLSTPLLLEPRLPLPLAIAGAALYLGGAFQKR